MKRMIIMINKIYIKLVRIILIPFVLVLSLFLLSSNSTKKLTNLYYDNQDESTLYGIIHGTISDVEAYLYNKYGFYGNYSCISFDDFSGVTYIC